MCLLPRLQLSIVLSFLLLLLSSSVVVAAAIEFVVTAGAAAVAAVFVSWLPFVSTTQIQSRGTNLTCPEALVMLLIRARTNIPRCRTRGLNNSNDVVP